MDDRGEPADSTDTSLIRRVRANEPTAWRELLRWIAPTVLYWCRRLGLERVQDREDVAQDVFAAVHRSIGGFRKERPGEGFRAWLRQITRNKAADHFRRRPPTVRADPAALEAALAEQARLLESDESQDHSVGARLLLRDALEAIRRKTEEQTWQAFWQTAVEGCGAREAAAALGMSPQAVRQAKARTLRRLRVAFEELL